MHFARTVVCTLLVALPGQALAQDVAPPADAPLAAEPEEAQGPIINPDASPSEPGLGEHVGNMVLLGALGGAIGVFTSYVSLDFEQCGGLLNGDCGSDRVLGLGGGLLVGALIGAVVGATMSVHGPDAPYAARKLRLAPTLGVGTQGAYGGLSGRF